MFSLDDELIKYFRILADIISYILFSLNVIVTVFYRLTVRPSQGCRARKRDEIDSDTG